MADECNSVPVADCVLCPNCLGAKRSGAGPLERQLAECRRLLRAELADESDCWNSLVDVGHRLQVAVDSMPGMSLPEQIEHGLTKAARLHAELAECRSLLREALAHLPRSAVRHFWREEAEQAAKGDQT